MATLSCLGQTLTLYRQGLRFALFIGLATLVSFNLPWHLIPHAAQILQPLVGAVGIYLAGTLAASRTPADCNAEAAAGRWL